MTNKKRYFFAHPVAVAPEVVLPDVHVVVRVLHQVEGGQGQGAERQGGVGAELVVAEDEPELLLSLLLGVG